MYVIAGLGNPGREYEGTRHNVGFMTLDALAEETPLERNGSPEDAARAAAFLCSEAADFITGQVVAVNGGYIV